ncbi:hypothetical protein LCGC14_2758600 [marine sediment metagenome]|uniref:Uncharacterized protein n=1 Tax=marine sediment metagenome TaxID=412755 RepID=A0A0F8YZP2_9ZZZZ
MTYKDWRKLWHETAKSLGWNIFFRWSKNKPILNKYSWILLHRLKRIDQRLAEVKDSTWCEAMVEILQREIK